MKNQFSKLRSYLPVLLMIVCIYPQIVAAQGGVQIETLPSTMSDGTINIYGRSTLSNKIPYDKISGYPFWKAEWQTATLIGRNKKEKMGKRSKIEYGYS